MVCGLRADGAIGFAHPLPDRGHAAAAHPSRPEAVVFARRPGTFARVIDCATGNPIAALTTPEGRHFYGHGVFSQDGSLLFTTENAYDSATGLVGIWNAAQQYRRLGEILSGGIGPHEIRRLPGKGTLAVANGGIETHPETGRAKLNIPFMRPNLSYLDPSGRLIERVAPPEAWHKNSMRHIDVRRDGLVAIACQWQGDAAATPPILATHRLGAALQFHPAGNGGERRIEGYAGSVAFAGDGQSIAITGPRGGRALRFDAGGRLLEAFGAADICGVAAAPAQEGHLYTTGEGLVLRAEDGTHTPLARHDLRWDNHLVRIA